MYLRRLTYIALSSVPIFSFAPLLKALPDQALEPILVQTTRFPQPIDHLIGDISWLSREDIAQAGATSLLDLLRQVSGIQVVQTGGLGKPMSAFLRGTNADHVVVLLDGVRIGSATLGLASLQNIPLDQIARIEILRGPASVWYGADAMGGIIAISTQMDTGGNQNRLGIGIGAEHTSWLEGGQQGQTGALRWAWSGGYRYTQGINAIANPQSYDYNPDRDGYQQSQLSGQLIYRFTAEHQSGINFFVTKAKNYYDTGFPTPDYDYNNRDTLSSWRWWSKHQWSPSWQSRLELGQSMDRTQSSSPPNPYDNSNLDSRFQTRQTLMQWHNEIRPLEGTLAGTALVDFETLRQAVASSVDFPIQIRTINSLILGYQQTKEQLSWQMALRRDQNSQFGSENTGSVGANYKFNPLWQLGGTYGSSFRAPTFNELYFPYFGNAQLRPEHGHQVDFFLRYGGAPLEASITAFSHRIQDLIASVGPDFLPMNIARARLNGISLVGTRQEGSTRVGGTFDYLQAQNDSTGESNGKWLPRRARHQVNAYVQKDFGIWQLRAEWFAQGHRYDDAANSKRLGAYSLYNLSFSGLVPGFSPKWRWQLRMDNIFGKNYQVARDYNMPKQTAFLSLHYQD